MPASPPRSMPGRATYARGEVVGQVDGRRVGRVVAVSVSVVLVGLVVATTVGGLHQRSARSRLQRHGVAVVATVTKCQPITSGIGQAVEYYDCTAAYSLDGRRHQATLGGSRGLHPVGQKVAAVAVPHDPALLSTASAIARRPSSWGPFVSPIVWAALAVAWSLSCVVWSRRRARRRPVASPASPAAG